MSSGYASELQAIESRFATEWNDRTPVAYHNVPFVPPENPPAPWVRLTVLSGQSSQASMGDTALFRHSGVIDVTVFVPAGTASKGARELVDAVAEIFRRKQFSGITCRAPGFGDVGVRDGWYQINVSFPFHRDAIF